VKRANATLFAAFFYFDISFMVGVLLGPLALFIAKDPDHAESASGVDSAAGRRILSDHSRLFERSVRCRARRRRVDGDHARTARHRLAFRRLVPGDVRGRILAGDRRREFRGVFAPRQPLVSPNRQGLAAMGVAGAGNSGTVLSTLFAPQIAAHIGRHATMAVAMLPVVVALAVFALIALRGRVWSGTLLLGRPTSYAFAIEEG
jgi:NNP family nitrate/nitrite transporter-like MFS transporter